jgi:hypothetical protein
MKNVSALILCLLITFTASTSFGQKARPRSNAPKPKTATKAVAKGNIQLEAGLIYKNGDSKPVARVKVYLIKEDLKNTFLTQEHLDMYNEWATSPGSKINSLDDWSLYGAVINWEQVVNPTLNAVLKESLAKITITSETTGFDGKATFTNIPTGNYFLFAFYRPNTQGSLWNVPISVRPGINKIILDNNNEGSL